MNRNLQTKHSLFTAHPQWKLMSISTQLDHTLPHQSYNNTLKNQTPEITLFISSNKIQWEFSTT